MRVLAILALLPLAAPALATDPPASPERRLTDAEVQQILDQAEARQQATEEAAKPNYPIVSGEVGASIGNHGYREAHATTNIDFGHGAFASFSYGTGRDRWGGRYAGYGPYGGYGPHGGYGPYNGDYQSFSGYVGLP